MAIVSLYICCSEDGFLADKNGGVNWIPEMGIEAQSNYEEFFASTQMVIMGSRSYQKVLTLAMGFWPYIGKVSYVFTKKDLKPERDDVKMTSEDPQSFVDRIKEACPEVRKIWLMGGAELIKSFTDKQLIDEILLFTVPKTLGEGIPLGICFDNFVLADEGTLGEIEFKSYIKKIS